MSIELRQLRFAVETADVQSFSRAAATLRVKYSTFSRRISLLEERFGVKLLERTTRGAECQLQPALTCSLVFRLAEIRHYSSHLMAAFDIHAPQTRPSAIGQLLPKPDL
jgi:hypothetical protein